jgi:Tol biopolymer transport system component
MRRLIFVAIAATGLIGGTLAAPASATYIGSEGKIAFVRANQIYTVAKTGGTVTKLTTSGKNYRPHWSPDGKRIAYINETTGGPKDVWIMSSTGTSKVRVTTSGTVNAAPVWSYDGKTLAFGQSGTYTFTQFCAPNCEEDYDNRPRDFIGTYVFVIKASAPFGSPAMVVVHESGDEYWKYSEPISAYAGASLAWAPNGDQLAVINGDSRDTWDTGVHFIRGTTGLSPTNAATTSLPEDVVMATGASCCANADWADLVFGPSGLFGYSEVYHGYDEEPDANRIRVIYPGFVSQQGDKSPAPSPTNKNLAFVNAQTGTPNIYTATIKGANRKMIIANGYQPDWQPT